MRTIATLGIVILAWGLALGANSADTDRGQQAFQKRCAGCHGLDVDKEGPALKGVFGRRAGSRANFPYSEALKAAGFSWDKTALDRWLTDPDAVVPGTDMAFRLSDRAERELIIAYLEQLK